MPSAAVMAAFDTVGARAHVDAASKRTIAVTSTIRKEGTSTVALGTALSFAAFDASASVLLIDANWLSPSLTERSGRGSARGLAEWLRDDYLLDRAIIETERHGLSFLPAGQAAGEPPPLGRLRALLDFARKEFAKIVIDLPPAMVAPALVVPWADIVDQTYLVVRRNATPVALIRKAMAEIGTQRPPQLILNRSHDDAVSWSQAG